MEDKKIKRLILKDDDILVVHVPDHFFGRKDTILTIQREIRKQLLPKRNKILLLPSSLDMTVIGSKEIKEYISEIDIWNLFDEDGKEIDDGRI